MRWSKKELNKNCPTFLGCHVAERVLSHVFKDVDRMPSNNRGYDFICNKGMKIDVKSACLHKDKYHFIINHNKIADYFLFIAFDNRTNLNPQHIWLIKSDEKLSYSEKFLNELNGINITNKLYCIDKFLIYELIDKLKETIECCNELKK